MDNWGCYRFSDGEDECLDSGRCGQCSDVSEDSVGSSGSMQQPGVIIHFFFSEASFSEEIVRKVTDGIPESRLDSVAGEPVYPARELRTDDEPDSPPFEDDVSR